MKGPLTPFHEARELVLSRCRTLGAEQARLQSLLGRVLAEPFRTTVDMPRFDNAAVDGYGITSADASRRGSASLRLVGESAAGSDAEIAIREGETARVLTGAPIPIGVDAIVMQEEVELAVETVSLRTPVTSGANIRRRAEEFAAGDCLLNAGTICTPPVVSLIASAGKSSGPVFRRPRVGILTTGNELVAPGQSLGAGQIYASNGFGLTAALESLGIKPSKAVQVEDSLEAACTALSQLLDECDVVLTSGGISVGSHDYLRTAFERCGVDQHLWGVAMKPGQPFFFGSRADRLVFGLPGNPVSTMVTYFVFVRTALLQMMGANPSESERNLRLTERIEARGGKTEFVRGSSRGDCVEPLPQRGSHMSGGLASANCLIHVPPDRMHFEAGDMVQCTPLSWAHI